MTTQLKILNITGKQMKRITVRIILYIIVL